MDLACFSHIFWGKFGHLQIFMPLLYQFCDHTGQSNDPYLYLKSRFMFGSLFYWVEWFECGACKIYRKLNYSERRKKLPKNESQN